LTSNIEYTVLTPDSR